MSSATLRSAWYAVADAWPQDKLRPNHQFKDAIRAAADRAFLVQASPSPADRQQAQTCQLSPIQVNKAAEAAASLKRLLGNEAMKARPLSERTIKPASFPKHYSRIIDAANRAEKGEVFKKPAFSWFRWK
ncbi:hypothetical protein JCM11641_005072 [Rhodosporidiobolus odoratus]